MGGVLLSLCRVLGIELLLLFCFWISDHSHFFHYEYLNLMKNILFLTMIAWLSVGCGREKTQQEVLTPVKPGTKIALLTDSSGNSNMISQEAAQHLIIPPRSIISTPPGASFTIHLLDNSIVHLNAASSIRILQCDQYQRRVELNGEAYFDVTTNPNVPFKVKTNDATITAFGTEFNVLGYPDEPERKVTLVNGAVQINSPGGTISMKPGQQVTVNKTLKVKTADLDNDLAWMQGQYDISNTTSLVRQVSRWHGLTPVFNKGNITQTFEGSLPKTSDLPTILKIFRLNGIPLVLDEKRKLLIY